MTLGGEGLVSGLPDTGVRPGLVMEAALVILIVKETVKPILMGERTGLDQPLRPEIQVVIQTG